MLIDTVFIELTNYCNCRCRSCPQSIGLKRLRGYLDLDLFKKIVDQAWTISDTVNLSFFGEPMLHPQFIQCLQYLQQRPAGKTVIIFSNFLCATQLIIAELVKTRLKRLHLSINASTSNTYDEIRSGEYCIDLDGRVYADNRFDILCNKVSHWFKTKGHPPTRHEFVVASYSIHELKDFVVRWLPLLGRDDEILTKNVLSYGGAMMNEPFLKKSPCGMWGQHNYLAVDWQGNVTPCFLDNGMKLSIGSVLHNSLKDIQNSKARFEVKRKAMSRTIEPCNTCIDASHGIGTRIYTKGSSWNDSHLGGWHK